MKVPAKFYAHSAKDSSGELYLEAMSNAGAQPEHEKDARYAGYEIEFDGYWDGGIFWATDVNGMRLMDPVKL